MTHKMWVKMMLSFPGSKKIFQPTIHAFLFLRLPAGHRTVDLNGEGAIMTSPPPGDIRQSLETFLVVTRGRGRNW